MPSPLRAGSRYPRYGGSPGRAGADRRLQCAYYQEKETALPARGNAFVEAAGLVWPGSGRRYYALGTLDLGCSLLHNGLVFLVIWLRLGKRITGRGRTTKGNRT